MTDIFVAPVVVTSIALMVCMPFQLVLAETRIDPLSQETLTIPELSDGPPMAGKRVAVTPPDYAGTKVFHTLYLPKEWKQDGDTMPIIFEYTGNYFPQAGSTGQPKDGALGYGLSGGKYIWVSLPYINQQGTDNEVTWWGDEQATVEYAKRNVPRIVEQFRGDPKAVFLCGFSRGAIGVNYLGLHDDQIAGLWTAFIAHDHFDGVKQWSPPWGSPLDQYRSQAMIRLRRVKGRPYWVSQNGTQRATEEYLRAVLPNVDNFHFGYVSTREVLSEFPNEIAKDAHTDRWPCKPSDYRTQVWQWMNEIACHQHNNQ
jgi:hypothetical protein